MGKVKKKNAIESTQFPKNTNYPPSLSLSLLKLKITLIIPTIIGMSLAELRSYKGCFILSRLLLSISLYYIIFNRLDLNLLQLTFYTHFLT